MSDILKRSLAPVTEAAWKEIDTEAARTVKGNLSARKLVDFNGPHGWNFSAVNLGRLKDVKTEGVLAWGRRSVLPLIEVRVPVTLDTWELDNIERGAKDADMDALIAAARRLALFEENALYHGFAAGGIEGMLPASARKAVPFSTAPEAFAGCVEAAVLAIEKAGIGGPYALVLGTAPYELYVTGDPAAYPLRKRVDAIAAGGVHWSPALKGGAVLSRRGGDLEMTVGQDVSIGYKAHDTKTVELYLTESFTFRVLEPRAVVELKVKQTAGC